MICRTTSLYDKNRTTISYNFYRSSDISFMLTSWYSMCKDSCCDLSIVALPNNWQSLFSIQCSFSWQCHRFKWPLKFTFMMVYMWHVQLVFVFSLFSSHTLQTLFFLCCIIVLGCQLPPVCELSNWWIHSTALHLASLHSTPLYSAVYSSCVLLQFISSAEGAGMPVVVPCSRYAEHAAEHRWKFLPFIADVHFIQWRLQ